MRVSLVCIAKNEDYYIKEWISYNKLLGFDNIFIYQNDWRTDIENESIVKVPFDGKKKQIAAYDHFLRNHSKLFDWVAFFDVDEFLVLKRHKNIKDFLDDYSQHQAVSINWVLFGDNGLTGKPIHDFGVVNRFTKRQVGVHSLVKTIVKTRIGNHIRNFKINVHRPNVKCVDTHHRIVRGPHNPGGRDTIAQINHYFCKTLEEFKLKVERGRADSFSKRNTAEFFEHNRNELEDLSAIEFFSQAEQKGLTNSILSDQKDKSLFKTIKYFL